MRAYERFLRYTAFHTTANDNSPDCPSIPGQQALANALAEELITLGVADARVDEYCCVYGTIPATAGLESKPSIGFISHLDTAEEAIRMVGLVPESVPIRGGTDGTTLSFMGLPCPNLGTGGFNFHGPAECITTERMDRACEVLKNIISLYAK